MTIYDGITRPQRCLRQTRLSSSERNNNFHITPLSNTSQLEGERTRRKGMLTETRFGSSFFPKPQSAFPPLSAARRSVLGFLGSSLRERKAKEGRQATFGYQAPTHYYYYCHERRSSSSSSSKIHSSREIGSATKWDLVRAGEKRKECNDVFLSFLVGFYYSIAS